MPVYIKSNGIRTPKPKKSKRRFLRLCLASALLFWPPAYSVAIPQTQPPSPSLDAAFIPQHLPQPKPNVFPDFASNYQATVVIPQQQAQEAAQQAAEAQAVQQAPAAPQASYTPQTGSCGTWLAQAGITDPLAISVIMRESGCNPNAVNASSGACGLGQQLPCGKWPHTWNDPVGALVDMQAYVYGTYGSWANAWASEQNRGWY